MRLPCNSTKPAAVRGDCHKSFMELADDGGCERHPRPGPDPAPANRECTMADDLKTPGMDWLEADLADTLDEDYELEISEPELSEALDAIYKKKHPASIDRLTYFRELLRLQ